MTAFTFADAEKLRRLPRRPRCQPPVPVPHPDRRPGLRATATTSSIPPRCRRNSAAPTGLARLSAAAKARGLGLVVDIVPNHVGVERPDAEPVVVGRAAARPDIARTRRTSTSTGTLDPSGRIVLPVLGSTRTSTDLAVDGDVLRLGDLAFPIAPGTGDGLGRRGARPPALQADRLAQRRLRLPTVLLDHLTGRTAPGGPGGVRRHPRRGRALVRRRTGRRGAHRPPRRPVRPDRLSGLAARTHRTTRLDRHREDPGRRRAAGPVAARRRHHRLRRAARDRRGVRRSRRQPRRSPRWRARQASTMPRRRNCCAS